MARPKKTTEKDLPKNWKDIIISNMSQGASKVEIKAELGISNDLFERFAKEDKEFSDTIKKGMALCEAWWQKEGRINLQNTKFSATLWYMNMKNRFGWKDKSEVEHSGHFDLRAILDDIEANAKRTNSRKALEVK